MNNGVTIDMERKVNGRMASAFFGEGRLMKRVNDCGGRL